MGISSGCRGSVTQAHSGANTNSVGAAGGTGGGAELVVTKLGNVRDSPLNSDQATLHTPKITSFAFRRAMEMKLSRLELKNYTSDSIDELKASELMAFLRRLDKTMVNTSNQAKASHIVCLLKEIQARSASNHPSRYAFVGQETNKPSQKCVKLLLSILDKLEKNEQKYIALDEIFHKNLSEKCKSYPFVCNTEGPKFEQNCFSGNLSTKELKALSIDILLKQNPDKLSKFIQRANDTIVNTNSPGKAETVLSLLHQLYTQAKSYRSAAIAGNSAALGVYAQLEDVLHSHLSEEGKCEIENFLRPKQEAPSNERRESVVSNAYPQCSVTPL